MTKKSPDSNYLNDSSLKKQTEGKTGKLKRRTSDQIMKNFDEVHEGRRFGRNKEQAAREWNRNSKKWMKLMPELVKDPEALDRAVTNAISSYEENRNENREITDLIWAIAITQEEEINLGDDFVLSRDELKKRIIQRIKKSVEKGDAKFANPYYTSRVRRKKELEKEEK